MPQMFRACVFFCMCIFYLTVSKISAKTCAVIASENPIPEGVSVEDLTRDYECMGGGETTYSQKTRRDCRFAMGQQLLQDSLRQLRLMGHQHPRNCVNVKQALCSNDVAITPEMRSVSMDDWVLVHNTSRIPRYLYQRCCVCDGCVDDHLGVSNDFNSVPITAEVSILEWNGEEWKGTTDRVTIGCVCERPSIV